MLFAKKNIDKKIPDIRTAEGFEQIYRTYWKKMYGLCYNQFRDEEVAKEIVQDIFKRIWERKDQLHINGPWEHYLLRAAKLETMSYFRTKATRTKHMECIMADSCIAEYCTDNKLEFDELSHQVDVLVDRLPCQCREVYRLSREKGLKNKEIASSLLISEKAVEYHMTKALKFLKDNLKEYKV